MKIGIDISQISYIGTGVSRFTEGLVDAILKQDTKHSWIFFYSSLRNSLDTKLKKRIQSYQHTYIEYKLPPKLLTLLWNTLHIIPIETFIGNIDLFISSDWNEPPAKCKKITVVHDLAFIRHPETIHQTILTTQRKRLYWVSKETNFIIADSYATKNDLIDYLKCDKDKIDVNYPGVSDVLPINPEVQKTLNKYHLKKPFIFTVGKIEPRKNLKRLFESYSLLHNTDKLPDLAIAGQKGWGDTSVTNPLLNNKIHLLGYVSDSELADLYRSCLFFIYPSLWEGFGYPIIEAMKYGAPVATSNSSSMIEIARDSALLFDPFDIHSIAKSMEQLIDNKNLRLDLQKKGTIRAKDFTWSSYYQKLMLIISKKLS